MLRFTAAALLLTGAMGAAPVLAQSPSAPNPTQQPVLLPDGTPVFRVTVVGRALQAVNYRPRHGQTRVDFKGTSLFPKAKGLAKISGEKGYMKIDAEFWSLDTPAPHFGPEYLTY